jgi:hypothetical protein
MSRFDNGRHAICSSPIGASYLMRTQEQVVLDDATVRNVYSENEYVRQKRPKFVLCLPIVKQTNLVGAPVSGELFDSVRLYVASGRSAEVARFASGHSHWKMPDFYSDLQPTNIDSGVSSTQLRRICGALRPAAPLVSSINV